MYYKWKDKVLDDIQSTEYDALVRSLNDRNSDDVKTCKNNVKKNGDRSLVQSPRRSRNQLHYQKFIKEKM